MNTVFWINLSGWVVTILFGVEVLLAYLLRQTALRGWLGLEQPSAGRGLRRMGPHFVVGAMLTLLGLAHSWIPMAAGRMRSSDMLGLWLATLALLGLVIQLLVGMALANAGGSDRRSLRRCHFLGMLILSARIIAHIALI